MRKPPAQPQIFLGFDFGMRRIGVAVGQALTQSASPLTTIKAQDGVPAWEEIARLIKTWDVNALIVGIPYNMDGTEQDTTFAARRFAHKLKNHFHLPVHLVDERLTTIEARGQMEKLERGIDSHAAKIILESWLRQNNKLN